MCFSISSNSEKAKAELTKHTIFTEYLNEEDQEKEALKTDLYFDLSYFKANRKVKNGEQVKLAINII